MTINGGEADDEQTRVDRDPPIFPRVGDSQGVDSQRTSGSTGTGAPLFTSPDQRDHAPITVPVVAAPAPAKSSSSKGSRIRWLVAGVATLVVLLVVGGLIVLAAPRAGGEATRRRELVLVTVLRTVVSPCLALLLGHLLGLHGPVLLTVVTMAALPTAQNVLVYATQYGRGQALARDAGIVTTILAVPLLLIIAAALG